MRLKYLYIYIYIYIARCPRKCDLGAPIYNSDAGMRLSKKKTSPKIWWIQKVVVPLHSQLQRKGGRKCSMHDWRLVATTADRSAHRASLEACLIQASGR